MRKFVCILLAMCAVPVFAAGTITVDVNDQGDGTGIVQITAMGGLPPVGIALVVDANDGADGDAVVDVNAPVDSFFDVFIDYYASNSAALDDNVFADDNGHPGADPAAAGALLAGPQVSLSMGELDETQDANALTLPIDLAVIDLGGAGDVVLSVDDLRGGVVDTAGETVVVTFASTTFDITDAPAECMMSTAPEYAKWVSYGSPDCWCYKKQCNGDADGLKTFFKPVMNSDLTLFKAAFNKTKTQVQAININGVPGICADFDHADTFFKPVMNSDLTIFKAYFNQADGAVPQCDGTYINFWTN